jgi:hypothetical protein
MVGVDSKVPEGLVLVLRWHLVEVGDFADVGVDCLDAGVVDGDLSQ